jgi:hypothetical protein
MDICLVLEGGVLISVFCICCTYCITQLVVAFSLKYCNCLLLKYVKICRFKCIDLDGNGILTYNEMQFFYEEQLHRMECMAQEPVVFGDILCQMIDMIGPEVDSHAYPANILSGLDNYFSFLQNESYFTLRDLKRCKLSGNIFNILFNLNKFMAFETRDPFLIRQVIITLNIFQICCQVLS